MAAQADSKPLYLRRWVNLVLVLFIQLIITLEGRPGSFNILVDRDLNHRELEMERHERGGGASRRCQVLGLGEEMLAEVWLAG